MLNKTIIAILGLPGSGKTETIDYLMEKYGWPKVYFGDVTFDEIRRRGLPVNEQNERTVREGLRAEFGRLHYADQVIKKIESLENNVILVESLYDWVEYKRFKEKFGDRFKNIAIYASPEIRYKRLETRKIRPLTRAEAQSRDFAQIENLSQAGPIAMADHTVINNADFDELYLQIDKIIKNLT